MLCYTIFTFLRFINLGRNRPNSPILDEDFEEFAFEVDFILPVRELQDYPDLAEALDEF